MEEKRQYDEGGQVHCHQQRRQQRRVGPRKTPSFTKTHRHAEGNIGGRLLAECAMRQGRELSSSRLLSRPTSVDKGKGIEGRRGRQEGKEHDSIIGIAVQCGGCRDGNEKGTSQKSVSSRLSHQSGATTDTRKQGVTTITINVIIAFVSIGVLTMPTPTDRRAGEKAVQRAGRRNRAVTFIVSMDGYHVWIRCLRRKCRCRFRFRCRCCFRCCCRRRRRRRRRRRPRG